MTPQEAQSKVLLVAVGIGDYPGSIPTLRFPAADAKAVDKVISKNGHSATAVMTDREATCSAIVDRMHALFDHASTDDIIIFFFSGHGYPGGFVAYDGKLSYDAVRKAMGASKCKNKMIFADACYAGAMRTKSGKVTDANQSSNVMLFLSSRSNETSLERADMSNGLFTTCLRDGLAGKADADRNRTITAREIFNYVSKNVKSLSRNRQHPVMWGNFSNNMPVIIW